MHLRMHNCPFEKVIVTLGAFSAKLYAKMRTLRVQAAFTDFGRSCKCTLLKQMNLLRILPLVY